MPKNKINNTQHQKKKKTRTQASTNNIATSNHGKIWGSCYKTRSCLDLKKQKERKEEKKKKTKTEVNTSSSQLKMKS